MATKVKNPATAVPVPQSRADCASAIKALGDIQREFERQKTLMNDSIAQITKNYQPGLELLQLRADTLT
jgi:phage host-nuclease inhibitor protein Gam